MTDQPLFDTPAAAALTAAAGHLTRARESADHEDQASTLAALQAMAAAAAATSSAEAHLVREARRQQATWRQIATALGITRQGATARFQSRGIT